MEDQRKSGPFDRTEESTSITYVNDPGYVTGDGISLRILQKWRSGVIICRWTNFFWDDDIEMK